MIGTLKQRSVRGSPSLLGHGAGAHDIHLDDKAKRRQSRWLMGVVAAWGVVIVVLIVHPRVRGGTGRVWRSCTEDGCSNHGVCDDDNGCACDPGWGGDACNKRVERPKVTHETKAERAAREARERAGGDVAEDEEAADEEDEEDMEDVSNRGYVRDAQVSYVSDDGDATGDVLAAAPPPTGVLSARRQRRREREAERARERLRTTGRMGKRPRREEGEVAHRPYEPVVEMSAEERVRSKRMARRHGKSRGREALEARRAASNRAGRKGTRRSRRVGGGVMRGREQWAHTREASADGYRPTVRPGEADVAESGGSRLCSSSYSGAKVACVGTGPKLHAAPAEESEREVDLKDTDWYNDLVFYRIEGEEAFQRGQPITIFTVPYAFGESDTLDAVQHNAIQSWLHLRPRPRVVLVGDEPGVAAFAARVGAEHVPHVAKSESGAPLLSSAYEAALEGATTAYVAWVEPDLILSDEFSRAVTVAHTHFAEKDVKFWAMVGREREVQLVTDDDEPDKLDFSTPDWRDEVRDIAYQRRLSAGFQHNYIVAPRKFWQTVPPYAVHKCAYNQGMLAMALYGIGAHVVDASVAAIVLKQQHDMLEGEFMFGEECDLNVLIAKSFGGNSSRGTTDFAQWILTDDNGDFAMRRRHVVGEWELDE